MITAYLARELLYNRYGHVDIIGEILRNEDEEYEALSDEAVGGKRFMVVEEHYRNKRERVPDAVTLHENFASVNQMYTVKDTLAIYDLDDYRLLASGPNAITAVQYGFITRRYDG
jgi:hypothetical protein